MPSMNFYDKPVGYTENQEYTPEQYIDWNVIYARITIISILIVSAIVSGVFAYSIKECVDAEEEEVSKLKMSMLLNVGVIGLCVGYITALIGYVMEMISPFSKFLLAVCVGVLGVNSVISYFKIRASLEEKEADIDVNDLLSLHEIIAAAGIGISVGMLLNLLMMGLEKMSLVDKRSTGGVIMSVLIGIAISAFHVYDLGDCDTGIANTTRYVSYAIIVVMLIVSVALIYASADAFDKQTTALEEMRSSTAYNYPDFIYSQQQGGYY